MPIVLARYAVGIERATEEIVKLIVQPGFNEMVRSTPVDTSQAVSNWVVSHGAPSSGVRGPVTQSIKGSGAGVARSIVMREGGMAIQGYRLNRPMYIVNNTPYISVLAYGGRKRKAHNMVRRGFLAMRARAKTIRMMKLVEKHV